MNLSESSIRHLERKAFLRGLERAVAIANKYVRKFDTANCDLAWGAALNIQSEIESEVEKIADELDGQEKA